MDEQLKWNIFFRKMAQGKIPYQRKFYCIDDHVTDEEINQEGRGTKPTIQLITPTQQHVQQAEAEVRKHLEEATPTRWRESKRGFICSRWQESKRGFALFSSERQLAWVSLLYVSSKQCLLPINVHRNINRQQI